MTIYPGAIDEFRTTQNIPGVLYDAADTKTVFAEDTNNHSDAIVAIENELGTNPAGAFANVASRLDNIESSSSILHVAHEGLVVYPSGGYQPCVYDFVFADSADGWDETLRQYTIPKDGAYMIMASLWYTTGFTAGDKKLIITVDGGEYNGINNPNLGGYETQVLVTGGYFNAGDIIKSYVSQNSGSTQYCDDYYSVTYLKIISMW